jgi:cyclohexa-1,5-dienecarbonyl-CoA hydratase
MSAEEHVRLEITDGVATVTIDRPPLNVLDLAMMADLNSALQTVVCNTDLAAVILRAKGKVFSAGVDVSDHTPDKVGEMIRRFHEIFRRLAATDALTIAAVQGTALGGGCELACFCDIVLASDRAKFGQPEVQVGVFPPIAACIFPPQIGIKKAIELNALGTTVKADEAHRIGLVNQVFPADAFDASVDAYLAEIRKLSRPVVRLAKRATTMVAREHVLAHLERVEKLYLDELMKLSDAHEGIAAFMEKRPAVWKHE